MPAWIHTHCPNCNMPYRDAVVECGACGRVREAMIVPPPPVVEAARSETYQKAVLPLQQRVTSNDGLTVAVVILVALVIIYLRLSFP